MARGTVGSSKESFPKKKKAPNLLFELVGSVRDSSGWPIAS